MNASSRDSVELRLLGGVRVRLPDGSTRADLANQRKRFALAVHLVLTGDPVPRETLTALLWPELNDHAARRALRQAVHFLREALGTEAFVSTGARELTADPDRVWCDAAALHAAFEAGDAERVVSLYGGELLPGFHVDDVDSDFEYWLDGERHRARDRAMRAYRRLIRERREAGRDAEAIELARGALEVGPTDEVSLRALVRLLDDRGDRLEAIQVYESFADRIRDRLGVEPSAETRGLVEAIRERDDPADPEREIGSVLPTFGTGTVGRDEEIERCLRALERGERFLTLTGPGGIGKSRLAIEVAEAWRTRSGERVVFVPLPASRPEDVRDAIVDRLGFAPRREPWRELERELGRRPSLLVLDGLEVAQGAATRVAGLATERVRVLVTSVAPLRVAVEREMPVPSLSLPAGDRPASSGLPLDSEAVALFAERARAVDPGFELTSENANVVAHVCRRLDGIPLAIELAAAQLRALSVEELDRRIAEGLAVLRQDVRERPPRQRTMAAAIRWSLDELGPWERRILLGLSVLRGEFSLEAAERIVEAALDVPLDTVGSLSVLVERGLVKRPRTVEGEPRYALLSTVRSHAREELERSGEVDRWHEAQCDYFESWVAEGRRHYCRPSEDRWLARLRRERDNLDGVLAWATERRPESAARIVTAVWFAWYQGGEGRRGVEIAERVLEIPDALSTEARAGLHGAVAALHDGLGDPASAVPAFEASLALYERAENANRIGWALRSLGLALRQTGELERAREAFLRALEWAEANDNPDQRVHCLYLVGTIAVLQRRADDAEARYREALVGARRLGSEGAMASCMEGLGDVAGLRGDWERAAELYERVLRKVEDLERRIDIATASIRLGRAARRLGEPNRSAEAYARAIAIHREGGYLPGLYAALVGVAGLELETGRVERATELAAAITAWAEVEGVVEPVFRAELDELVEQVRRERPGSSFEAAWRRGEMYAFEDLLAVAEQTTPPTALHDRRIAG